MKNSKTKVYALGLDNIPKDFAYNNIKKKKKKKKKRIKRRCFFSIDFNPIDTDNILDNHKSLIKGK